MIKSLILTVVISFTTYIGLFAQQMNDTLFFDKFSIGITPSALINTYNAVQVNYNFGLTKRLRAILETGYIFSSLYSKRTNGYRLKYGLEWMLKAKGNGSFILGINGIFRQVNEKRFVLINHPERYREKVFYNKKKSMQGLQLSLGQIIKLNNRLKMSYLIGAGLGAMIIVDEPDIADFEAISPFVLFNNDGDYIYPILSFNIKYMYTFAEFR